MDIAEPVNRLVEQFKKLPGIGTKSAQRLAFFILKMDQADASELAETILEVKRSIRRCSTCNNLTDVDPCQFCTHPSRSDRVLCVVEESNRSEEHTSELQSRELISYAFFCLKKKKKESRGVREWVYRREWGRGGWGGWG